MADTKTVRALIVLEAYSDRWAPWNQKWKPANHIHLPFDDDLSKYEIITPAYSCTGIIDTVTILMKDSKATFKNLRWLGTVRNGPHGNIPVSCSSIKIIVEHDVPVINKTAGKPPFRELAERELVQGLNSEAGPILLNWYEEFDDYTGKMWTKKQKMKPELVQRNKPCLIHRPREGEQRALIPQG